MSSASTQPNPASPHNTRRQPPPARWELGAAAAGSSHLIAAAAVFSVFVNLLMLTGPLFMLQVYDRVLASQSLETLTALSVLMAGLFLLMGVLDFVRSRVMSRVGARIHERLSLRLDQAVLTPRRSHDGRASGVPTREQRVREAADCEEDGQDAAAALLAVQNVLSSPAPLVLFDMPWAPVFIGALFLFHPALGLLAVAGGCVMLVLALLNQWRSRALLNAAQHDTVHADQIADTLWREREVVSALGMAGASAHRLDGLRRTALRNRMYASDRVGAYASASRAMRFFLQSAMLALGAFLAIGGEISAGMMIAASILLGRALAPIEQGIGQWSSIHRGLAGWRTLGRFLRAHPALVRTLPLPPPEGNLVVHDLTLERPGQADTALPPVLTGLNFSVAPGEALGVIGPSASGKSSLARALVGVWPPACGEVRLDGATLDQWLPDDLGRHVGYLPQDIVFLPGTIAENIARFRTDHNPADVLKAASDAGAHGLILRLPHGYDTLVGTRGGGRAAHLSGGQRQRIALARALFGAPSLVVMDEPNAHLDADGERALVLAIRKCKEAGAAVVVMAHRPSAISACDQLLLLEAGTQRAFGPRDDVLREHTRANTRVVPPDPASVVRAISKTQ